MLLAKTLRSSTFKLALAAILAFGAIVAGIFAYVYVSTSSYVRSRSDRAIASEFFSLEGAYLRSGRDGLVGAIQQRSSGKGSANNVYLLVDPSGTVLAGTLKSWPLEPADMRGWREFRLPAAPSGASPPLVRAMLQTLPNGDHLLVGQDISELDEFTGHIKVALMSGLALIFVLAGAASILVTRRTVGRIEQINVTSRAIMQSGPDKRIPLRGSNDEWDRVAENLNLMLDRIEALMREIKQVSDNVAHDLRTPLTRVRGRLERAYHAPRGAEQDEALIADTIADLDAVLRIFASISRIAQIETPLRKAAFRSVNLAEVAAEVVELYDAAAEQDGTALTVTGDPNVQVTGDRDLIFDAIANLVDNAIKHGRAGGKVVVTSENLEDGAVVAVSDNGPGIPADQHEHVFKRFYRIEHGRGAPGNGLGLSLVAAVARLHGARVDMCDNAPGLKVSLVFGAPA